MANTKKYISLDKLGVYDEKIKGVISDGDAAALKSAKDYADSLATNYEAAGNAATEAGKVQTKLDEEVTRAKAREDEIAGLVATAQGEVDALEGVVAGKAAQTDLDALAGKVGEVPADQTVMGIITNIQENAYDDTEIQNAISGLESTKADKTQVATDIENAVNAEKSARETAVAGVQGAVDALSGTHATDKKNLEDAIALKASKEELQAVSDVANAAVTKSAYDVKVKALEDEDARIVGLVEAEATKAREEEGKLDARLVEVETFFKTAEGETIDQAMDTLVEIQKYITEDGAAADQMVKDIAANKKAIEDHAATNHDFAGADAALKAELVTEINKKADSSVVEGIDGRLETAEESIETIATKLADIEANADVNVIETVKVNGVALTPDADKAVNVEVPTGALASKDKVAEADLEAALATKINGKADQTVLESAVTTLTGADDAIKGRLNALEAIDHSHENADVLAGITSEKVAAWDTVSSKATQSDLEALAGRVSTEEGKVSTLQTEMDAVEALADAADKAAKANAEAIKLLASQEALNAVSNRVGVLETWHNNFVEASQEDINELFA